MALKFGTTKSSNLTSCFSHGIARYGYPHSPLIEYFIIVTVLGLAKHFPQPALDCVGSVVFDPFQCAKVLILFEDEVPVQQELGRRDEMAI